MEKPNEGEGQRERRFSQEQYDMLKRCSDKKDMTEWNQWRKQHPEEDICLDGADFAQCCLRGANFMRGKVCEENERTIEYTGEIHLDQSRLGACRRWPFLGRFHEECYTLDRLRRASEFWADRPAGGGTG